MEKNDIISKKTEELFIFFSEIKKYPKNFKLFLIFDKEYIRINKGKVQVTSYLNEISMLKELSYHHNLRGDILDNFSKLDFIINEIILLNILSPTSEKRSMLEFILDNTNPYTKLRFLYDNNIINHENKQFRNLFEKTRKVRNVMAHEWSLSEAQYNKKPLKDSFKDFEKDLKKVWKEVIRIYKEEQSKIDIESIKRDLLKYNE